MFSSVMKLPLYLLAILSFGIFIFPNSILANSEMNPAYQHFSRLDLNGDGIFTETESKARMEILFLSMDADSDGYITEEEFKNGASHIAKVRQRGKDQDFKNQKDDKNDKLAKHKELRKKRFKEHFTEVDTDSDRRLSKKEFDQSEKRRFNIMDTGDDGRVSLDEFITHLRSKKDGLGRRSD